MILEFDLGNSRFKWRLLMDGALPVEGGGESGADAIAPYQDADSGVRIAARDVVDADPAALRRVVSALGRVPRRVRGSSVASRQLDEVLAAAVRDRWGIDVEFAGSAPECAGVRNAYLEPSRLGVDRWLALLAAYRRCARAVLVVDAGSALTADLVGGDGGHLGGYITPGRRMLLEALRGATARVRFASVDRVSDAPGRDTASAVEGGVRLALRGALKEAVGIAVSQLGDFDLVVTGGDAEWLLQGARLSGPVRVEQVADLVMDGLQWALP